MAERGNVYLAACLIYRNHARYLREWIEFHMLMGFERFYLYDNGSDDDHLEILEPYLAEDIVAVEHWPIPAGQFLAFEHCLGKRRGEARWIAFIDIDEFLFSPTGKPLPEILKGFEQYPGVVVNLANFGTSGHKTEPDGLVIQNYVRRAEDKTFTTVKSIVDPRQAIHCWGAHSFLYVSWTREYEGATSDEPIWGTVLPVSERHERIPLRFHDRTPEHTFSLLRVNHYYTQSEEQVRKKMATPRPDTGELRDPIPDSHLEAMNRVHDETIQMHLPALRQAIRDRESGQTHPVAEHG
jgi:hypothetical protein